MTNIWISREQSQTKGIWESVDSMTADGNRPHAILNMLYLAVTRCETCSFYLAEQQGK